ncbi:hypothetical protein ID866_7926 [Astraeus odoratus]|nr:hypothetical protein ID866_7926 [Astraeus odoratus]
MNPRSALERFKVFERSSQYSIDLTGQVDIVDGFIVRGGCGTVYKGILRDNRVEVAIKVPPGGVSRDETVIKVFPLVGRHCQASLSPFQRFLEEVHVWSELSHQNVLPYFGITTQLNFTVSLVSQWMYNGNAHDYVQDVTVDPRPLVS